MFWGRGLIHRSCSIFLSSVVECKEELAGLFCFAVINVSILAICSPNRCSRRLTIKQSKVSGRGFPGKRRHLLSKIPRRTRTRAQTGLLPKTVHKAVVVVVRLLLTAPWQRNSRHRWRHRYGSPSIHPSFEDRELANLIRYLNVIFVLVSWFVFTETRSLHLFLRSFSFSFWKPGFRTERISRSPSPPLFLLFFEKTRLWDPKE